LLVGYAIYVEKGVSLKKSEKAEAPQASIPTSTESPFSDMLKNNQTRE
jgi:hypothetical protein